MSFVSLIHKLPNEIATNCRTVLPQYAEQKCHKLPDNYILFVMSSVIKFIKSVIRIQ